MSLPRIDLDNRATAESIRKHAADMSTVVLTASRELQRKGQATQGEAILREGLTPAEMAARAVHCIVGFNMGENDGCTEVANTTCPTCTAICCAFHQAHDMHKEHVSETLLLKQQQALAQQRRTSRAGAPDVAPPKETTSVGGTSAAKKIRKNTWPDLEARYQQIKGEAYVRPPKQRVGEFQLMVEGLEARNRGQHEPAQAKNQLRPPTSTPTPGVAHVNNLIPESMVNGLQLFQQLQLFFNSQATSTGIATSISTQANESVRASGDNNGEVSDDEGGEVFI